MKRLIFILATILQFLPCSADIFSIVFKDSGKGSDQTQEIKSTSSIEDYVKTGEDYVTAVSSSVCYYAKSGYGLKLGKSSDYGTIVLYLNETYKPTAITVTAAAYDGNSDLSSNKGFMLNDTEQPFSGKAQLTDYVFAFDGDTEVDSIMICGTSKSYNRFYLTKIVIEAPDPAPDKPLLKGQKNTDWGFEHLIEGIAQTSMEYEITSKNLREDISMSLHRGHYFSILTETLSAEGGIVQLGFRHSQPGTYSDTLLLSATSNNNERVSLSMPMTIRVLGEIAHTGEIDDPYTVTDAIHKTDELSANETSVDSWYITGAVTNDEITVSNTNGGLNFYIADKNNSIYVYSLSGEGGTTLNADDIHVGDTLLIRSRLQNYVGWQSSNKEIYLGELINSEIPVIDWREVQPGYYDPIQDQSDTALMRILGNIVNGGTRYTYGSGAHHTWDAFYYTDRDENSMLVLDMYSDNQRYFDQAQPTASVANLDIEHILPKSWWGGAVNNAYKDLYHLVPADYSANRSKGNDAPGQVLTAGFDNGVFKTGTPTPDCPAPRVFEPADEYKGDFARAYLYILTAYADFNWDMSSPAQYALDPSSGLLLQPWLQDLLLEWHRMDPVSDKELQRIRQVSRIQHNRNPFIDYPCLVEYIWGSRQGEQVDLKNLLLTSSAEYQTTDDKSGCTCECTQIPDELPALQDGQSSNQQLSTSARVALINGTLLIIRNGQTYTITGQPLE